MSLGSVTIEKFKSVLKVICAPDTSYDPKHWTKENYLWGHCAVVSVLAQDYFQGEIVVASLLGTEFSDGVSHFWNILPDGSEFDFTRDQFGGRFPSCLNVEPSTREYILSYPQTRKRYELLSKRFQEQMPK